MKVEFFIEYEFIILMLIMFCYPLWVILEDIVLVIRGIRHWAKKQIKDGRNEN